MVEAFALQLDLVGSILLLNHTEDFQHGIHNFPAWRSAWSVSAVKEDSASLHIVFLFRRSTGYLHSYVTHRWWSQAV